MTPLLALRQVTLHDRPIPLNLELEPGMQALFITTDSQETEQLLQLLTGDILPENGHVLLDGALTSAVSRQQLFELRRQMGIVTASGGLIANLKLWENITLPLLYCQGTISKEAEKHALDLLQTFAYGGKTQALPGHLTPFERRMVSFIRAAIGLPRLILYAGCFDNLPADQFRLLFRQTRELYRRVPQQAAVYITSSFTALPDLHPDGIFNLRPDATNSARD